MSHAQSDTGRPFLKMHGAGNDFVVFDAREEPLRVTAALARAVADRRTGIGCDQVIVIRPSERADAVMEIWNADGGEVSACGNAARCVGRLLLDDAGGKTASLATRAGLLRIWREGDEIAVDMGAPKLDWADIPLADSCDTLALPIAHDSLVEPVAVSMGNPHAVFFVDDPDAIDLGRLGPVLEHHPLFPERANITVAAARAPDRLSVRVWERGAGLTAACGTAACATLVAAHRRGLAGRDAQVALPGGVLTVHWAEDDHVHLIGPAETSFSGRIDLATFGATEAAA